MGRELKSKDIEDLYSFQNELISFFDTVLLYM